MDAVLNVRMSIAKLYCMRVRAECAHVCRFCCSVEIYSAHPSFSLPPFFSPLKSDNLSSFRYIIDIYPLLLLNSQYYRRLRSEQGDLQETQRGKEQKSSTGEVIV